MVGDKQHTVFEKTALRYVSCPLMRQPFACGLGRMQLVASRQESCSAGCRGGTNNKWTACELLEILNQVIRDFALQ
jgi:hypothetical protein